MFLPSIPIGSDKPLLSLLGEHEGPPDLLLPGCDADLWPCLRCGLHLCDNLLVSVSAVKARTYTHMYICSQVRALRKSFVRFRIDQYSARDVFACGDGRRVRRMMHVEAHNILGYHMLRTTCSLPFRQLRHARTHTHICMFSEVRALRNPFVRLRIDQYSARYVFACGDGRCVSRMMHIEAHNLLDAVFCAQPARFRFDS